MRFTDSLFKIYGPGGQDVFTDSDGPILVYRKSHIAASSPGLSDRHHFLDYYNSSGSWVRFPARYTERLEADSISFSSVSTALISRAVGPLFPKCHYKYTYTHVYALSITGIVYHFALGLLSSHGEASS